MSTIAFALNIEGEKKTFDIQRENIAVWNGINHLQSLIVFQRRRNTHTKAQDSLFLLYLKR